MFTSAFRRRVAWVFELIGRHPTPVLALPSAWMFWRFLPFWKDVDAVHQLLSPAWAANILHFPPIYCFGGRLPFWIVGKISGHAPTVFDEQHPSLPGVFALILLQHAGLWVALRYFLVSLPLSKLNRGIVTVLLASVASFYVFAHTCGSEAITSISWFVVFGAGFRILTATATWRTWVVYIAVLFLAIGSRQINVVLLAWLPFTALLLTSFRRFAQRLKSREARIAASGIVAGLAILGIEHSLVAYLSHRFNVIERSTLGGTLSDRIATLVNQLSVPEREQLLRKASALTTDPNVRLAVASQIELGSYHLGTDRVIRDALKEQGLQGEQNQAESDRVILRAMVCFYETLDPKLIAIILKEFARGWAPTSDYRVALSGPFATFLFARVVEEEPSRWNHLPPLPFFDFSTARRMLEKARRDPLIGHWQGVPILVWFILFAVIGAWRLRRKALPPNVLLIGLTALGAGIAVYGATCLGVFSQPRYTLPLLVSVFVFGSSVFSSGSNGSRPDSPTI